MDNQSFPSVVDYAFEIVRMHQKIESLEAEVESLRYYKSEYFKLFGDTTRHSQKLFGIMIAGSLGDFEAARAIAES
jgi:hypothetical protein